MASIAYLDHSFHEQSQSNMFLVDILRRHGHEVDIFWDDLWDGGEAVHFNRLRAYDIVIMFQNTSSTLIPNFNRIHPNVIFVPMLDTLLLSYCPHSKPREIFKKFDGSKVISFSTAMHCFAITSGLCSLSVKYYPQPVAERPAQPTSLRGFFWLRNSSRVSWPLICALLGESKFENLHIHIAPDPKSPTPVLPTQEEKNKYNITTSTWFERKEDYMKILENANVFFAPRLDEGIGQSFLEAMSYGQCVVAPDNGTMNEYILHGLNGLLYDANNPKPLDFTSANELGDAAFVSVKAGYARWKSQEESLMQYIENPSSVIYEEHLKKVCKYIQLCSSE